MTKKMKRALIVGVLCLLVCLSMLMVSCRKQESDPSPTGNPDEKITYTIEVKTEGGMALEGVGMYIYTDATQTELVWFAKADAAGKVTFTDVPSDSYIAVLRDVPEGYLAEESYPITGEFTQIVLSAELVEGDLSDTVYQLGDVIHDFSVTTPDGTVYTLSELLEQKDAVVLNFWYLQCQPCRAEFPYLQQAYEKYSSKIEILALNPVNADDEGIAAFQKELGLTFPMAQCDADWERLMQLTAYPTTVVIDRYGTISMIHKGSVTEAETFENVFKFFTADNYEQTLVEDLESLEEAAEQAQLGSAAEPVEIGGVKSFTVTIPAGQTAYYNVYKVSGMYMQIKSSNVSVVYKGKTYNAKNGSVGMTVTSDSTFNPIYLQITNTGDETETYTVTFGSRSGTINNPYTASLGQFTTKVSAGNDQGVYYNYKATQDGYLVLENLSVTSGVGYDYVLYNLNSYAYRTLGEDGGTSSENSNPMVYVKVKKGQTVQIIIGTLPDSTNSYPAATFTSNLYFTETLGGENEGGQEEVKKTAYAVTVTDSDRNPMPGVAVVFEGENGTATVNTDASGAAAVKLPVGTYTATVILPHGYEAKTSQVRLTEAKPMVSVKLDAVVVEYADYKVSVVDEEGNPVSNVTAIVGSNFGTTDAQGAVSFHLLKESYTAQIVVPEGYTADNTSADFENGAVEVVFRLKKGSGGSGGTDEPEITMISYQVKVLDYQNKPVSGAMVQIKKDGTIVTAQKVSSGGIATAELAAGKYTVDVAFSNGVTLYYDPGVLTESVTSITIHVAEGASGKSELIYVGNNGQSAEYNAQYLEVGGTYVKLQANTMNYFLFTPTKSGLYKFTTSDSDAKIYYYATSMYSYNATEGTDYDAGTNSFTRDIKQSNLGVTHVIGVSGASDCVVIITRIGEAGYETTSVEWKGFDDVAGPVKQTTVPGGTLKYVDLTAASGSYKLYLGSDGYYHLKSATGPIVYVNLGTKGRYISFYEMLGIGAQSGTGLKGPIYYEGGRPYREDYTVLFTEYCKSIADGDPRNDGNAGDSNEKDELYPLNRELEYILKQGGTSMGWWDSANGNYLFGDVTNLNEDIAWMFNCCYFE